MRTVRNYQLLALSFLGLLLITGCNQTEGLIVPAEMSTNADKTKTSTSGRSFVIGGFDISRGESYSFPSGSFLDQARASLNANFPRASFTSFSTLTPTALTGVDILILSSATSNTSHIVPLSTAEQNTLRDFVEDCGCAILFPENSTFGGGGTPAANESLIDPFGMDIAGTLIGRVIATVSSPSTSLVTNGPFGTISSFSQNVPGGLTNLGPFAISLATNPLGSALAVIKSKAISKESGPVVIYTDINTFGDTDAAGFFPENEALFLNTINFCLLEDDEDDDEDDEDDDDEDDEDDSGDDEDDNDEDDEDDDDKDDDEDDED